MANEHNLHRLVSQFMLDTCRYTKTSEIKLSVFRERCLVRTGLVGCASDSEVLSSGSTAEFYITPMLTCIGDVDLMICYDCRIAIPPRHTPPTELPAQYHDIVNVFEIIDSHQPGYVYLQPSLYVLTKVDSCRYVAKKRENSDNAPEFLPSSGCFDIVQSMKIIYTDSFRPRGMITVFDIIHDRVMKQLVSINIMNSICEQPLSLGDCFEHGPALSMTSNEYLRDVMADYGIHYTSTSVDLVSCMRCRLWPLQAADWPKRSRSHGWPDITTIHVVVSNGCDVVPAVHPSCRQDEWMNEHQWRLSFSRAEVTLLNSWTPVQQVVYHMLRFVMKHEVLLNNNSNDTNSNDPGVPTLSNYHIKTLMLWECEQKPQSWWSADSSIVKLCSSLLHELCGCVADKHCRHYFINNCNLVGHFLEDVSITICNDLKTVSNESFLLMWFVENYVCKCISTEMSLLDDTFSVYTLQRAIDVVIDEKFNSVKTVKWEQFQYFDSFESQIYSFVLMLDAYVGSLSTSFTVAIKKELQNVDLRLQDYFIAIASLNVSCKISIRSLTEDLLELLWTLFDSCNEANVKNESRNFLSIRKAIKLATLSNVRSNSLEMLHNEMSKAYLHLALTCGQESADCVVVVNVLLAALYYKSGHYLTATDHCKQVLNKHGREQCGLRSIGAEFLPRIDDSVDCVFGLIVFYQHVRRNVTDVKAKSQPMSKPAFTTDLLAYYLYSRCSAITHRKDSEFSIYRQHLCQTYRLFLSDILLLKVTKLQLHKCIGLKVPVGEIRNHDASSSSLSSMDTSLMVTVLELAALEKLTAIRQQMVRELHTEEYPVLNEFEALLAYKCGLFEECLNICRSNVNMLLPTVGILKLQSYALEYPVLLCLLDGELVSVCGIVRLLQPKQLLICKKISSYYGISMLTLSLYLMAQCQKKLRCVSDDETCETIRLVYENMVCAGKERYISDRLTLKMTYRSLKMHAASRCASDYSS